MIEEPPRPVFLDNSPHKTSPGRVPVLIFSGGALSFVAAVALFLLTTTNAVGGNGYVAPGNVASFGRGWLLTPHPTATAMLPTPDGAPIAVLAIPKYDVSAPVVTRSVDSAGVMQTPDGPTDVAWYDFSAKPGYGSNAVFAAHVDYANYGPAVFWHLKDLQFGDAIEVRLDDGAVYPYEVVSVEQLPVEDMDIDKIVGGTPREVITLITCGGTWTGHEYNSRVVVRAERSHDAQAASPAVNAGP